MSEARQGFVVRNSRAVTPGYDGPEGTEYPLRTRAHRCCPIVEPHIEHGMWMYGYSGQRCGGVPSE